MKDGKAPRVNAVHRGLQMLEFLAGQKRAWSTSDISRRLKIPKSSASYLLHTLEARGYLHREEEGGGYRLSMKMLALGSLALVGLELREVAPPILRRLVADTGITGHVGVLEGSEAVYIERVPSSGFIQLNTWVGRRIPLHSSGEGKTLLAFLPSHEAEALFQTIELRRFTPKTIVSVPRLRLELKKIRENGFAVDDEENTPGVRCVGAPIFNRAGSLVGALSLTGPVQQLTGERLIKVAEKVKDAARQMTQALGGNSPVTSRKFF